MPRITSYTKNKLFTIDCNIKHTIVFDNITGFLDLNTEATIYVNSSPIHRIYRSSPISLEDPDLEATLEKHEREIRQTLMKITRLFDEIEKYVEEKIVEVKLQC